MPVGEDRVNMESSFSFRQQPKGFATKAIHAGQEPEQWKSLCVIPPITMSTTFKQDGPGQHRGFEYSRSGNPIRQVLERCLAALDDAQYGLTFSSGLGAITATLALLQTGDHIVVGDDVYGGTNRLMRYISKQQKIEAVFIDPTKHEDFLAAVNEKTKLVWIETPTNPLMKVADIQALSEAIHRIRKDIIVVVDNTFLTSYFQRPLELGADLVCYSLTKYMNGHTDVVMGAITTNSQILNERLKFIQNALGIVPSPFDCYQVNRSLKTLALRMEQHQTNALEVAKFLQSHSMVTEVLHPSLPSHPNHQISLKQTYGYSGVFSFYIKGNLQTSETFLKSLQIFTLAESLGGYESLAELPSIMTHSSVPEKDRLELGITDCLIRLSVGLEDINDLLKDIENALTAAAATIAD